ncbi:hypothetical protein GEMRC1_001004 [Eukaryota sp. GEM-RC1]
MNSLSLSTISRHDIQFHLDPNFSTSFSSVQKHRHSYSLRHVGDIPVDLTRIDVSPSVTTQLSVLWSMVTLNSNAMTLSQYTSLHLFLAAALTPSLPRDTIISAAKSDFSLDGKGSRTMTKYHFFHSMLHLLLARCPTSVSFASFLEELIKFINNSSTNDKWSKNPERPSVFEKKQSASKYKTFAQYSHDLKQQPYPMAAACPTMSPRLQDLGPKQPMSFTHLKRPHRLQRPTKSHSQDLSSICLTARNEPTSTSEPNSPKVPDMFPKVFKERRLLMLSKPKKTVKLPMLTVEEVKDKRQHNFFVSHDLSKSK